MATRLEKMTFNTPVGRFVSGSMTEKRTTDNDNRPIEPEKQRFEFGVAFRKDDPAIGQLISQIGGYAMQQYQVIGPHIVPKIQQWFQTMDGFSMKVSDGDKPNARGQVNENTKGCFVLWFSTALDVQACGPDNSQLPVSAIKRGWYVDIYGSTVINELTNHQAGIYMNPAIVRLIAEGDEIVGSIDPRAAFASNPAPTILPPGARPVGSTPAAPGMSGPPSSAAPALGMPAPGQGYGQAPQMPAPGQGYGQAPQMPGAVPPTVPGAPHVQQGAPAFPQANAASPGMPTASPFNPAPYPGILQPPVQR